MAEEPDDRPRSEAPKRRDLSVMSVEELQAYIAELEAEIARVRTELEAKQSVRGAAEALFKIR